MKTYLSSKIKAAGKIVAIEAVDAVTSRLILEGDEAVQKPTSWVKEKGAQVGGYFVQYPGSDNYQSFEPAKSFENSHVLISSGMTFGQAFEMTAHGMTIARAGWNGKNQFVYRISATDLQSGLKYGFGEYQGEPAFVTVLCLKNAQNQLVVGWLPSSGDLFANDWQAFPATAGL